MNFFSSKEYPKEMAALYYRDCYGHFEKFISGIQDSKQQALFENAFMGKDVKTVFLEETGCPMDKFGEYLTRYFLKLAVNPQEPDTSSLIRTS